MSVILLDDNATTDQMCNLSTVVQTMLQSGPVHVTYSGLMGRDAVINCVTDEVVGDVLSQVTDREDGARVYAFSRDGNFNHK